MTDRNYWLNVFTPKTWNEFLEHGGNVSGNRESRWNKVQKFKLGDYMVCYATKTSRFIGVCEVISKPYKETTTIWEDGVFPLN